MQLPSGTITLLMTDIEGSIALWERYPQVMPLALTRHDELAVARAAEHQGVLVKSRGEGDSLFLVFCRASDALACACALQQAYLHEAWANNVTAEYEQQFTANAIFPSSFSLKVRMALHTGETLQRDNDYYGATVNRCARIRATAHGGQVLLSEMTYNFVRDALPQNVFIQDLGWHRLKDLQQPEHLFQAHAPDWKTDFPPLNSLELHRNNLPLQLTSFLGRKHELAEVQRRLETTRLLTLIGPGGCGKTRLALQAAAELLSNYPAGVWCIELAAIADPELIPVSLAKVLNLSEVPGKPLITTVSEYLREKKTLLVIDNCEHIRHACAQLVRHLLKNCPSLSILATSRARLGVAGESFWSIPSLPVPIGTSSLQEAISYEAIQLFVERATEVHLQFYLNMNNLSTVIQICYRLDGIPLAIEMAAARVSVLTPEQINARLDRRFRLLTNNDTTTLERHQTLTALIDWSYDLLSEPERKLLRRLSVFVGGWTLEAAERVCIDVEGSITNLDSHTQSSLIDDAQAIIKPDDVLDLLTNLIVNASLVVVEDRRETRRYRLLETIRQYAAEKLEQAEEMQLLRSRHLEYCMELAEEAEPHLDKSDQKEWLDRLEIEHDNLRAALSWSVGGANRVRLASALWRFWYIRGHINEGRGWLEGSLVRSQSIPDLIRAKALYGAGVLAREQGDYTAAQNLLEQSLEIYQKLQDRLGCGGALLSLGRILRDRGDHEHARFYYEESLAIYQEIGDLVQVASALNNLGGIEVSLGRYSQARSLFERSLDLFQQKGHFYGIAFTLHNLGETCLLLEEHSYAHSLLAQSLKMKQSLGDGRSIALTLGVIGKVAKGAGQYNRAVILFGAAAALRESVGVPLPPADRDAYEMHVNDVRELLGEQRFTEGWQQGQATPLDEILAFAVEQSDLALLDLET